MIDNNSQNGKGYNLYNFEASFRSYLLAGNGNKDTLKNYLSDFRHFCGFVMRQSKDSMVGTDILVALPIQLIQSYKEYLVDTNLPRLTINRRLSTVRKFCTFCISQGWMKENPGKSVTNVSSAVTDSISSTFDSRFTNQHQTSGSEHQPFLDLVFEYENTLDQTKLSSKQIKKELGNLNEFLSIISAL